MTHKELRQKYHDFFESRGHMFVAPASLVPNNDPTVLFTVAGMQQFKPFYSTPDEAPSPRVYNIQPCIRTVDIDEVGDDTHSTVFEMMGFFSFGYQGGTDDAKQKDGPYFKQSAIRFAWDFYTKELGFSADAFRVTYFGGDAQRETDTTSHDIIQTLDGLSLIEPTVDDNFWGPVGDEGPCGPCVEFYYNGVEIGNVVFNEYHKDRDGNYTRLEYQGVDTGLGFDRVLCALQEKASIYQTDLLKSAMTLVEKGSYNFNEKQARIIVDHTKAAFFLLAEGVKPGNKSRDYILRRLIRRAVRAAQVVGFDQFKELFTTLCAEYGETYTFLTEKQEESIQLFELEREKFLKTLKTGTQQLEKLIGNEKNGEITGEQAFKLFDTYGFPIELTEEMVAEHNWTVDRTGFEEHFSKHREQSRAGMENIFKGGLADHETQTVQHHTAHHLLLAALRQILGSHVVQRGSNVTQDRFRIDVSHPEKITDDQLQRATDMVNQKIQEDLPVVSEIMDRDEAYKQGALSEFGAKYPAQACVYSIIDQNGEVFSREFCGGPHVNSTGELGRFEILKEEGAGAGIRRIRARVVKN
jgi:alanyl-tRNA synthetase